MCKRTYEVQKNPNNDSSYRSFVCSLLIFLTLCSIIIIAGNFRNWGTKSSSTESRQEKSIRKEETEQLEGTPPPPNTTWATKIYYRFKNGDFYTNTFTQRQFEKTTSLTVSSISPVPTHSHSTIELTVLKSDFFSENPENKTSLRPGIKTTEDDISDSKTVMMETRSKRHLNAQNEDLDISRLFNKIFVNTKRTTSRSTLTNDYATDTSSDLEIITKNITNSEVGYNTTNYDPESSDYHDKMADLKKLKDDKHAFSSENYRSESSGDYTSEYITTSTEDYTAESVGEKSRINEVVQISEETTGSLQTNTSNETTADKNSDNLTNITSNLLNESTDSETEIKYSREADVIEFFPGVTEKLIQHLRSNKIMESITTTVADGRLQSETTKTALSQTNKTEIEVSSATLSVDQTTPFKYVDFKPTQALITTKFTKPMDGDITRATTEKEEISGERSRDTTLFRKSAPVCHTSECKSVGSHMLSLMNDSIDACEDFYAFSCGGVHKDNADSDTWDVLLRQMMQISDTSSDHLVKFRSFYNSCLEFQYQIGYQEKVNQVTAILGDLGFNSSASLESMELSEILSISLYLNSLQFMKIGVTSSNILDLSLPEESSVEIGLRSALWTNQRRCLAEQRRRIYEPDLNLTAIHESYFKCLRDNQEMEALVREACVNHDIQHEYVDETIVHLKKMKQIYPTQADIKETIVGNKYVVFKVQDLQKNYPYWDWAALLKKLTNTGVLDNNLVHVYFKDYFKQWFKEFSKVKNKKHFLLNLLKTHLYYNLVLHKQSKDVEKYCLKTTSSIFNDIASNLYLKNFKVNMINEQKNRAVQIFDKLKKTLNSSLLKNEYIPAIYKLNKIKIKFSSATETCDDRQLENKYKTLQGYQLYQKNLVTSLKFKMEHILNLTTYSFGNIVNTYDTKPVTFYEDFSAIYVPLGMVVGVPFNLPTHVTLGKIGFPLAKAIAKHFDPVGIHIAGYTSGFDNLISNTNELYTELISDFRVKPSFNLSLYDRISDNTALRLVTDSYENLEDSTVMPWLHETQSTNSTDKVLLLAVAQELCEEENLLDFMLRLHESNDLPGPMRVNNIFRNSDYFSEAYKCPEGSEMNANPFKSQFPYVTHEEDEDEDEDDDATMTISR